MSFLSSVPAYDQVNCINIANGTSLHVVVLSVIPIQQLPDSLNPKPRGIFTFLEFNIASSFNGISNLQQNFIFLYDKVNGDPSFIFAFPDTVLEGIFNEGIYCKWRNVYCISVPLYLKIHEK